MIPDKRPVERPGERSDELRWTQMNSDERPEERSVELRWTQMNSDNLRWTQMNAQLNV